MTSQEELRNVLARKYDRILFINEILKKIFDNRLEINSTPYSHSSRLNASEKKVIKEVNEYGKIILDDDSEVILYEVVLHKNVRIEQNRISIQKYIRKLLLSRQSALINFISPSHENIWRLTFVAKKSEITDSGVVDKITHSKRYSYIIEEKSPNRTLAERLDTLSKDNNITMNSIIDAFSVEKMSKEFFDEYKKHYLDFVEYLTGKRLVKEKGKWKEKETSKASPFMKSIFNGDKKGARDFVKKLLGRIVFLYFVQRKAWLGASDDKYQDGNLDFMMNLYLSSTGKVDFYHSILFPLFFETLNSERKNDEFILPNSKIVKIPFLNGGLFEKGTYDSDLLTFPDELFHNVSASDDPKERGFLNFLNAYNFTVYEDSQDDHTVAVDPEMLGHIFENLLEDNKEKGAYYTPKEIVHYMTQQSLIEYLVTHLSETFTVYKEIGDDQIELFGNECKTGNLTLIEELGEKSLNREDIELIVIDKDISKLTKDQLLKIDALLISVRICDPAIGSGAFLMGLLLEIHQIKELIAHELDLKWDAAKVKEDIIQNSIYGVDIEKGAVDIARLRFWLSLLVDEDKPRPLPNLDYKIVVGDSLISKFDDMPVNIRWNNLNASKHLLENQKLLQKILQLQKKYFHAELDEKKNFKKEIRDTKIEIVVNQFSHDKVMLESNSDNDAQDLFGGKKTTKQLEEDFKINEYNAVIKKLKDLKKVKDKVFQHFDWKLDFPEIMNEEIAEKNPGFDIVIGNPPYISVEKFSGTKLQEKWKQKYRTYAGRGDIYCLFYEQGINLLRHDGVLSFISSNKFQRAGYGKALRQLLNSETIHTLIDFCELPVFSAATDPMIVILIKSSVSTNNNFPVLVVKDESEFSCLTQSIQTRATQYNSAQLKPEGWSLEGGKGLEIINKLQSKGIPLGQFIVEGIMAGIKTGYNKAFWLDASTAKKFQSEDPKVADNFIKPLILGDDARRWLTKPVSKYIIYTPRGTDQKNMGKLIDHLSQWRFRLSERALDQKWFELQQAQHRYSKKYEMPKIIYPDIALEPRFSLDISGRYPDMTAFSIPCGSAFLVALLNSSALWFFLSRTASILGDADNRGRVRCKTQYVSKMPIPTIPELEKEQLEKLSVQATELAVEGSISDLIKIEHEIDSIVYRLFDLTNEEIAHIENALKNTRSQSDEENDCDSE